MSEASSEYPTRLVAGLAAAIAIGVAVIAICNTAWAVTHHFPLLTLWEETCVSAMQILMVSAPYILLALLGIDARRPWIVGLCLTAIFWGYYLYSLTRPYEGGGADIGLGILMMFSPFPITGAVLLTSFFMAKGAGADAR